MWLGAGHGAAVPSPRGCLPQLSSRLQHPAMSVHTQAPAFWSRASGVPSEGKGYVPSSVPAAICLGYMQCGPHSTCSGNSQMSWLCSSRSPMKTDAPQQKDEFRHEADVQCSTQPMGFLGFQVPLLMTTSHCHQGHCFPSLYSEEIVVHVFSLVVVSSLLGRGRCSPIL